VASNIAAIAASNGESTTAAAINSGTLTGMPSGVTSLPFAIENGPSTAATTPATPVTTSGGATSAPGAMVPLSAIAHWEEKRTSLTVNHQGQYPAVTLTFNLAPNVALGDAVTALQKAEAEMGMPSTVHATFQGTAQAFQESLKNEPYLILAAIVAVYIVLGILYESYIHPLTILSGLPSAGFGALVTLTLFRMDLNIYAFVGLIMLIGIVKKNAIMQIDFALDAERQGMPPMEAIYQGCLIRFRPIMMTTMAALLGAVPIAIGYGAGGEARQPLGLVVVGGLLFSQLITLYLTPVYYTYLARFQESWLRRRASKKLKKLALETA
jgi:hydrophobic/amphiphilic exporter-1 (mainly G- bacteria), HAE1 family